MARREMFRCRLICEDVPKHAGQAGAECITEEFVTHRKWHESALCSWDGSSLILEVVNDFDDNGLATQDEFSDMISGCIAEGFDGELRVVSVVPYWEDDGDAT